MTKEEKNEYAKEYYRRNKNKILEKQNKKYHEKTGSEKYYDKVGNYVGTIDELKGGKRYYIPKNEKRYLEKKQESPLNKRYKGFKFSVDGGIVCMEVKSQFRIMFKNENGVMRVDENAYRHLQCELRRRVAAIEKTNLVIVDDSYIQVYMRKDGNIDAVVECIKEFIMEQTKIYGKYKKRGRYIGAQF